MHEFYVNPLCTRYADEEMQQLAHHNAVYFAVAYELLTACQAIDIRRRINTHGHGITPLHEALFEAVRKDAPFYEIDREIWPDIRAVEKLVRDESLLRITEQYLPDLK